MPESSTAVSIAGVLVLLVIGAIVALMFTAISIVLQIFLCRRKQKWAGLILPAVTLLIALVLPWLILTRGMAALIISIIGCIPVVVELAIYFVSRAHMKKSLQAEDERTRKQLNKMNIQDLD